MNFKNAFQLWMNNISVEFYAIQWHLINFSPIDLATHTWLGGWLNHSTLFNFQACFGLFWNQEGKKENVFPIEHKVILGQLFIFR